MFPAVTTRIAFVSGQKRALAWVPRWPALKPTQDPYRPATSRKFVILTTFKKNCESSIVRQVGKLARVGYETGVHFT